MTALVDFVRYNDLPSLEETISRQVCTDPCLPICNADQTIIQAPSVDDTINGPIRDLFLNHGANIAFCLYRQHRHHTVGADEAVVKVEGTAHLMDSQAVKDIVSFGNKVVPTTWMTSGGKVLPMEFAVIPAGYVVFLYFSSWVLGPLFDFMTRMTAPVPTAAFCSEFLSVLAENGCEGLFGIDTMAKGAWSEMKIGDASVVVSSNDSDGYDQDRFIPVAFAFDEEKPKFRVHGKCGTDHKHTSKPPKSK